MAVYTELSHDEIRHFLGAYDLPPLQEAEGICAGVENTNYLLTLQGGGRFILTLFEKRVAEADLPFFVGLMEELAAKRVPAPMPLRAKDGQAIRTLKGRPAVMVTFLEGKSAVTIKPVHISELGAAMARLHMGALEYKHIRCNSLSLPAWRVLLEKISPHMDEIAAGLAEELQAEMAALESLWPKTLPEGVIHADLFPDNVFYDAEGQLTGIIDFYFSCNDFLSYDLAICLNCWCFEKDFQFNITRAKGLLRAYNDQRLLSEEELNALPVLARGAALRFLLTRAHDWLFPVPGALVTPKDPMEYLKKLRFHRSVKHHREYGL